MYTNKNLGLFFLLSLLTFTACRKNDVPVTIDPAERNQKILLKDIISPRLPSPYYHFEYSSDSEVSKVSFASGFSAYNVVYAGNHISEMTNNIIVNHDTLRYFYNDAGKTERIDFIREGGKLYRHVHLNYTGQMLSKMEWDHREGNGNFSVDRTLTFSYLSDGNLGEMTEHRPAINGQPATTYSTRYSNYDDKVNVDDFSLLHDGFHDHFFLLSGSHLQHNNPRTEVRVGDGVNYSTQYIYSYNDRGAPLLKSGDVFFTQGSEAGKRFSFSVQYSYYE